jgi:predicted short-subunit dehydrogenase-like oxidoreductase (DUF2520 family)
MKFSGHSNTAHTVGIVGTGRLASALGALLSRRGDTVSVIAGRNLEKARKTAHFAGVKEAVSIPELPPRANHVLIAVSDDALPFVAPSLAAAGLRASIVLHTAAAAGPAALAPLREQGNATGVLHPLQTIPTAERGVDTLPGSAFAYAGDAPATAWANELVVSLGGKPLAIDAQQWGLYHAAAVFASNYHVTLIDSALELLEQTGLSRSVALEALAPLVQASVANTLSLGPERALTGPISRGDTSTVQAHRSALANRPSATRSLYAAAGLRTLALALRSGLPAQAARELNAALEAL